METDRTTPKPISRKTADVYHNGHQGLRTIQHSFDDSKELYAKGKHIAPILEILGTLSA